MNFFSILTELDPETLGSESKYIPPSQKKRSEKETKYQPPVRSEKETKYQPPVRSEKETNIIDSDFFGSSKYISPVVKNKLKQKEEEDLKKNFTIRTIDFPSLNEDFVIEKTDIQFKVILEKEIEEKKYDFSKEINIDYEKLIELWKEAFPYGNLINLYRKVFELDRNITLYNTAQKKIKDYEYFLQEIVKKLPKNKELVDKILLKESYSELLDHYIINGILMSREEFIKWGIKHCISNQFGKDVFSYVNENIHPYENYNILLDKGLIKKEDKDTICQYLYGIFPFELYSKYRFLDHTEASMIVSCRSLSQGKIYVKSLMSKISSNKDNYIKESQKFDHWIKLMHIINNTKKYTRQDLGYEEDYPIKEIEKELNNINFYPLDPNKFMIIINASSKGYMLEGVATYSDYLKADYEELEVGQYLFDFYNENELKPPHITESTCQLIKDGKRLMTFEISSNIETENDLPIRVSRLPSDVKYICSYYPKNLESEVKSYPIHEKITHHVYLLEEIAEVFDKVIKESRFEDTGYQNASLFNIEDFDDFVKMI